MRRITVFIEDDQYDWLNRRSEETGASSAEILRRAIDHWINVYNHPLQLTLINLVDPKHQERQAEIQKEFGEKLKALAKAGYFELKEEPVTLESIDKQLKDIQETLRNLNK